MNNIYVDELPKKGSCFNGCPYAVCDGFVTRCPFQQEENGDHLIVEADCIRTCPLKKLSDRLAEERKKVIQEIKDKTSDGLYQNSYGETFIDDDIYEILDQVERNIDG